MLHTELAHFKIVHILALFRNGFVACGKQDDACSTELVASGQLYLTKLVASEW